MMVSCNVDSIINDRAEQVISIIIHNIKIINKLRVILTTIMSRLGVTINSSNVVPGRLNVVLFNGHNRNVQADLAYSFFQIALSKSNDNY